MLNLEHPESAHLLRVWLLAEKQQYEEFFETEKIDPAKTRKHSAVKAYETILSFTSQFTPDELKLAQLNLARIDDVENEFDAFPFHDL